MVVSFLLRTRPNLRLPPPRLLRIRISLLPQPLLLALRAFRIHFLLRDPD